MLKIFKRVNTRIFKYAIQRVTEESSIRDKKLNVFFGSIRKKTDYDDAWMLMLGIHHDKIIDVGCNMGQSSLLFSYQGPKRMVLVDPQPIALAIAFKNLIDNRLADDVNYVCAFVSDEANKTIEFWSTAGGAAGSRYKTHAKSAEAEKYRKQVVTTTIDEIALKYLPDADLVKIDVEGAEYEVLRGSIALATTKKTKFFIEMHANKELSMITNAGNVLKWCEENQYECWYLKEHSRLSDPAVVAHRGKCHLLLIPKGATYPEYLRGIKQGSDLDSININ